MQTSLLEVALMYLDNFLFLKNFLLRYKDPLKELTPKTFIN